jgi:enoyl-CoA hydratase
MISRLLRTRAFSSSAEFILYEKVDRVALIKLNRPKALNALCDKLIRELNSSLKAADEDSDINVVVLTGSEKAFAAGADVKEMLPHNNVSAYKADLLAFWADITLTRKPIIAAVSGFALGGGCELAMMCDIIIAADNAKFGQPEITLGTIPGAGGSQRLTRAIGKSRAMELILTGAMLNAEEALARNLVSRVVPKDELIEEAMSVAKKIASFSQPIVMMAKEAVNKAFESPLSEGVKFERRLFHASFGFEDRLEGMTAFTEKRKPSFKDK